MPLEYMEQQVGCRGWQWCLNVADYHPLGPGLSAGLAFQPAKAVCFVPTTPPAQSHSAYPCVFPAPAPRSRRCSTDQAWALA